jgi:hypothetical protein
VEPPWRKERQASCESSSPALLSLGFVQPYRIGSTEPREARVWGINRMKRELWSERLLLAPLWENLKLMALHEVFSLACVWSSLCLSLKFYLAVTMLVFWSALDSLFIWASGVCGYLIPINVMFSMELLKETVSPPCFLFYWVSSSF